MKPGEFLKGILTVILVLSSFNASAQEPQSQSKDQSAKPAGKDTKTGPEAGNADPAKSARQGEDDTAKLLYLKNYIEDYRLGPEDVINVEFFGPQVQVYSERGLKIPPDGKINYKLIGQIVCRGRTVQDVEKEITEKMSEYIIDPKVTVQLVDSHSMKYIVDGDVGRPNVYEMTRRMTIREAIVNAGGILATGDRNNVQVVRSSPTGTSSILKINYAMLEKGKIADEPVLPGDMIFVPGNRFKTIQKWTTVLQTVTWLPMMVGRRF